MRVVAVVATTVQAVNLLEQAARVVVETAARTAQQAQTERQILAVVVAVVDFCHHHQLMAPAVQAAPASSFLSTPYLFKRSYPHSHPVVLGLARPALARLSIWSLRVVGQVVAVMAVAAEVLAVLEPAQGYL